MPLSFGLYMYVFAYGVTSCLFSPIQFVFEDTRFEIYCLFQSIELVNLLSKIKIKTACFCNGVAHISRKLTCIIHSAGKPLNLAIYNENKPPYVFHAVKTGMGNKLLVLKSLIPPA